MPSRQSLTSQHTWLAFLHQTPHLLTKYRGFSLMKNISGGFLISHCDQQMNLCDICLESPFFPIQASKCRQRGVSPQPSPFLRNTAVLGQIHWAPSAASLLFLAPTSSFRNAPREAHQVPAILLQRERCWPLKLLTVRCLKICFLCCVKHLSFFLSNTTEQLLIFQHIWVSFTYQTTVAHS